MSFMSQAKINYEMTIDQEHMQNIIMSPEFADILCRSNFTLGESAFIMQTINKIINQTQNPNEAEYYLIPRSELFELLKDSSKLNALESGGVDNWEWHGDACWDYIREYAYSIELTENDEEFEDFGFEDIADHIINCEYEPLIQKG